MGTAETAMAENPFHSLIDAERALAEEVDALLNKLPPNANHTLESQLSFGDRVADKVAAVAGSWSFIIVFVGILGGWMAYNTHLGEQAFDPYPFILLNLVLSTIAALQAPVIMMSQNRQAARDRLQADLDYQINVQAEKEIAELKSGMEELRRQQLAALLAIQQEQLALIRHLAEAARLEGHRDDRQAALQPKD